MRPFWNAYQVGQAARDAADVTGRLTPLYNCTIDYDQQFPQPSAASDLLWAACSTATPSRSCP